MTPKMIEAEVEYRREFAQKSIWPFALVFAGLIPLLFLLIALL